MTRNLSWDKNALSHFREKRKINENFVTFCDNFLNSTNNLDQFREYLAIITIFRF
jgi:hypothetical protein